MKKIRTATIVIVVLLILTAFSGCRFSDVLEEVVLDHKRAEQLIDDYIFEDLKDAEIEDEQLPEMETQKEAKRQEEPKEDPEQHDHASAGQMAAAGTGGMTGTGTASAEQESKNEEETTKKNSEPKKSKKKKKKKTVSSQDDTKTPQNGDGEEEEPVDDPSGNGDDEGGSAPAPGGQGTKKTVYGPDGSQQELPENVYGVAAVGDTAVAVMMIGGQDCLKATSQIVGSGPLAQMAFSGMSAEILWDDDGSYGISDAGIDRLLDLDVDVVVESSGDNMLTESQAGYLTEHGISLLTVPRITSTYEAKTVADMLGQALGDGANTTGVNAQANAERYCSWVDSNAASVAAGEQFYTLVLDDWDDSAAAEVGGISANGAALIQIYQGNYGHVATGFLSEANVINCTLFADNNRSGWYYYLPFQQGHYLVDGYTQITPDYINFLSPFDFGDSENEDADAYVVDAERIVGGRLFPYLIAGNNLTRNGMLASFAWQPYPYTGVGSNAIMDYALVGTDGKLYATHIRNDLSDRILVNPAGVSAWNSSSLESVLEPIWAAAMITGSLSQSDMENRIQDFYASFYGV